MEVLSSSSCRLCAQPAQPSYKIFGETSQNFKLFELINQHFPVKVSYAEDNLPKIICKVCYDQCVEIHVFFERIRMAELKLKARIEEENKKLSIEKISEKLNRLPNIRLQRIVKSQPTVKVIAVTQISPPAVVQKVDQRNSKRSDSIDEDYSPRKRRRRLKPQPKEKLPQTDPKGVITMSANYVCQYCRSRFDTFEQLKSHLKESDKCKFASTTCTICNKIFSNRKTYYTHSLTHREKFVCDCGKSYVNKLGLENHKATHTETIQEKLVSSYECAYCNTLFNNQDDLREHMQQHGTSKKETVQTFAIKSLPTHSLTRNFPKVKQFPCKKCSQSFITNEKLIEHELVHQSVIECTNCGERTSDVNELNLHLKNVHPSNINETKFTRSSHSKTVTLQFSNF